MKTAKQNLIIAGVIGMLAASAASVSAQVISVTIDEKGNGNVNGTPLPFGQAIEPFSGLTTLMYTLPFGTVPGDVRLFENAGSTNASDIARFDTSGHLFFFSDLETTDVPPFDLADGQLPPPVAALPVVGLLEAGPEGQNGALYSPGQTDPGFDAQGVVIQYNIISDVPEPSTAAFAGLGAAALMIFRRRE